ncbi:hypothetical protein PAMP_005503 [Pampus punctatissimus]
MLAAAPPSLPSSLLLSHPHSLFRSRSDSSTCRQREREDERGLSENGGGIQRPGRRRHHRSRGGLPQYDRL